MGNLLSKCTSGQTEDRDRGEKQSENSKKDKRSKNVYRKRSQDGKTVITNKVTVGKISCSIGENAKNVTINYNKPKSTSEREESQGQKKQPGIRQVFQCRYTKESAENEQTGLLNSPLTDGSNRPLGNFVDTRKGRFKYSVYEIHELGRYSHSVCQIRFANCTATGFRVGSKYIVTAYHVVKAMNDIYYPKIGPSQESESTESTILDSQRVYCLFDYFQQNNAEETKRFNITPTIHFKNESTDTAILELAERSDGTPMPAPFETFGILDLTKSFTFMGHSEGQPMECNTVDIIIDKNHPTTVEEIQWVKEYSTSQTNENFEYPPNSTLRNEHRFLFHCQFSKGASGSPGLVVEEDRKVVVVTMLLCGYPDWIYGESVDSAVKAQWPKEYCIEQGADMAVVGFAMSREKPELYTDIFCRPVLPAPAI